MQHDRRLLAVIFRNIVRAQAFRHGKIQLNGAELPYTLQTVFQRELDLGTIKGAFARLQFPLQTFHVEGVFQ